MASFAARKVMALGAVATILGASCVKERCYYDSDCPSGQVCGEGGRCVYECVVAEDCGEGFECKEHKCVPKAAERPIECPEDMVLIAGSFCIDRYEASRPDATATDPGKDESRATSRQGVLPWLVPDNGTAEAACEAAGKRLCTPAEWEVACKGPKGTVYAYGDEYDPKICNGIETFGPGKFHLMPTGSFPDCKNDWGVYDMNGNVWEHVLGGDAKSVRGGAYNCSDSKTFHRCDYVPRTWTPAALGFRCCLRPGGEIADMPPEGAPDLGHAPEEGEIVEKASVSEEVVTDSVEQGGGCVTTDEGGADPWPDLVEVSGGTDVVEEGPTGPEEAKDGWLDLWDGGVTDPGPWDVGGDEIGQELQDVFQSDEHGYDVKEDGGAPDIGEDTKDLHVSGCPPDMVEIVFGSSKHSCIDKYEASHSDATATSKGESPVAASQPGVLPWFPVTYAVAKAACEAAGKRLCKPEEWFDACRGPDKTVYSYGDTYSATVCNGIDTFCYCEPYPHCYQACGASFHVMPTGSFPQCTNEWGVYDINGNVWELVDAGDGLEHFRGGAYNCSDSEALHRCDYDATWGPSAKGFRCCKDL